MTRRLASSLFVLCCAAPAASAQVVENAAPGAGGSLSIASFDPEQAVAPISIVEGPGWKVGEGTVVHPVFGLETGFVSNVFYQDVNEKPAGVLRLLGQVGIASLNTARLNPSLDPMSQLDADTSQEEETDRGGVQWQANVRLAYDQPLSGDEVVRDTGGLGVGALVRAMINPSGTWSVGLDDNFARLIRAANFETTTNENRDINQARINLLYHPRGRAVSGYLYYQNTLDIFENSNDIYPDRMDNRFGIHPMWRWLPQTTVYLDASIGVLTGIGSSMASMNKPTSYPLIARLGIATLLSLKTTLNVSAGYTNGFYSAGPTYSAPTIDANVAYRYSPLGRVGVGYSLTYQDSVNANYYRDHVLRAFIQQGFEPFVLMVQPELHFREYNGVIVPGPMVRDDTIFALIGGIHYNFRNWIAATLDYRFATVQTDYRYMDANGNPVNPSYVRHDLLLGLRVAM
jgi:hypothetical protein